MRAVIGICCCVLRNATLKAGEMTLWMSLLYKLEDWNSIFRTHCGGLNENEVQLFGKD